MAASNANSKRLLLRSTNGYNPEFCSFQNPQSAIKIVPQILSIPGFAEPFSSLSHLLGAGMFALLSTFLLKRGAGNAGRMASLAVFCFGSVFLLLVSGLYHLIGPDTAVGSVMHRLDHAAIFILIACTYTPPHIILFRGWLRWGMLLLIWSIAVVSITLKMIYFGEISKSLGLALYLGMGWIGVGPAVALCRRHGFRFIQPIFWGGLAYSIGAFIYGIGWPVLIPGVIQGHEVFHVAVLIGLAFHWEFIYDIADGRHVFSEMPGN